MSLAHDIKMILTLHCDESSRLLSDGMERQLRFSERVALRMHLLVCRSCRRFRRDIQLLRGLMHHLYRQPPTTSPGHPPLAPEERERIHAAVRKAREDSP